jgi:hypothetical protein
MATSTNEITGNKIASKIPSQEYLSNFDSIFRKTKIVDEEPKVDDDKYVNESNQQGK